MCMVTFICFSCFQTTDLKVYDQISVYKSDSWGPLGGREIYSEVGGAESLACNRDAD
jgi:hypothetical protein